MALSSGSPTPVYRIGCLFLLSPIKENLLAGGTLIIDWEDQVLDYGISWVCCGVFICSMTGFIVDSKTEGVSFGEKLINLGQRFVIE